MKYTAEKLPRRNQTPVNLSEAERRHAKRTMRRARRRAERQLPWNHIPVRFTHGWAD